VARQALFGDTLGPAALAGTLDNLADDARFDVVGHLGRRALAAMYDAAADNAPLALTDFVPADIAPRTEVIHEGKNSLPLFAHFQKRFCRAPQPASTELWGYNEQPMRPFTGPGYFVCHLDEEDRLVIDYRTTPAATPDELPPGWPPILPNSARLSRFIYNGTVDVMRRVSQRVSVGRAHRAGKPMDAWFALVRRNPREVRP
jgi:hypothetical protein